MSTVGLAPTMNPASLSLSVTLESSPDGTILMAGSGGNLLTSAGTWSFGTATDPYGNIILLNGQSAGNGYSTELEVANSGHMYAGSNGQWWEWSGTGWAGTAAPSTTTTALGTQIDNSGGSAATAASSDLIWTPSFGEKDLTSDHTFTFADMSEFGPGHDDGPSASTSFSVV